MWLISSNKSIFVSICYLNKEKIGNNVIVTEKIWGTVSRVTVELDKIGARIRAQRMKLPLDT